MTAAVFSPATVTPSTSIIPPAPAHLDPWRQRDIIHSGELAIAKGLTLVGRGTCRVAGHVGDPVWIVSSASRPSLAHLVWVEVGRIMCDCEARKYGRYTCTHAQFVRRLIVAERATPASVPPAAASVDAAPVAPDAPDAPEPEPEPPTPPTPPTSGGRVPCPTCGGLADADEVAQLGECLNCLQMRADMERADRARVDGAAAVEEEAAAQLPCWACGGPATAETDHGLYCDQCVRMSPPALALAVQARQKFIAAGYIRDESASKTIRRAPKPTRPASSAKSVKSTKEETARRIIAREQTRERAGIPSAASPRAARTARRSSQPAD